MRRYRIAVIPGDGVGKEVIPAGLEVLEALAEREGGFEWTFDRFDWGSDHYRATGLMMPADGREQIANHDAIYTPMSVPYACCRGSSARCARSAARSSTG